MTMLLFYCNRFTRTWTLRLITTIPDSITIDKWPPFDCRTLAININTRMVEKKLLANVFRANTFLNVETHVSCYKKLRFEVTC